jgi:hypothetical protein
MGTCQFKLRRSSNFTLVGLPQYIKMCLDRNVFQSSTCINLCRLRLTKEPGHVNDLCSRRTHRSGCSIHWCSRLMPQILWQKRRQYLHSIQHSGPWRIRPLMYSTRVSLSSSLSLQVYFIGPTPFYFFLCRLLFTSLPPQPLVLLPSYSTFQKANYWFLLHLTIHFRLYLELTQCRLVKRLRLVN